MCCTACIGNNVLYEFINEHNPFLEKKKVQQLRKMLILLLAAGTSTSCASNFMSLFLVNIFKTQTLTLCLCFNLLFIKQERQAKRESRATG